MSAGFKFSHAEDVVIKDCTVDGYDTGFDISHFKGGAIVGNAARNCRTGFRVAYASTQFERNTAEVGAERTRFREEFGIPKSISDHDLCELATKVVGKPPAVQREIVGRHGLGRWMASEGAGNAIAAGQLLTSLIDLFL